MTKDLSNIEKELIHLIADGKNCKEIAAITKYSETSVETMRQRLFRKLNAINAPNLIHISYKNGILKSHG